jgi:hypothetical protein
MLHFGLKASGGCDLGQNEIISTVIMKTPLLPFSRISQRRRKTSFHNLSFLTHSHFHSDLRVSPILSLPFFACEMLYLRVHYLSSIVSLLYASSNIIALCVINGIFEDNDDCCIPASGREFVKEICAEIFEMRMFLSNFF